MPISLSPGASVGGRDVECVGNGGGQFDAAGVVGLVGQVVAGRTVVGGPVVDGACVGEVPVPGVGGCVGAAWSGGCVGIGGGQLEIVFSLLCDEPGENWPGKMAG